MSKENILDLLFRASGNYDKFCIHHVDEITAGLFHSIFSQITNGRERGSETVDTVSEPSGQNEYPDWTDQSDLTDEQKDSYNKYYTDVAEFLRNAADRIDTKEMPVDKFVQYMSFWIKQINAEPPTPDEEFEKFMYLVLHMFNTINSSE